MMMLHAQMRLRILRRGARWLVGIFTAKRLWLYSILHSSFQAHWQRHSGTSRSQTAARVGGTQHCELPYAPLWIAKTLTARRRIVKAAILCTAAGHR